MRVEITQVKSVLETILVNLGFDPSDASLSARLFTEASRDGVHTHGLNRFRAYVESVAAGHVNPKARPTTLDRFGAFEQWDGNHGPGNVNAWLAMGRAVELSEEHGIGCVALANTNHWMRAGSYARQAADRGCIGICWTNTIANMPPWGGREPKLGNNPLAIGVPNREEHIVIDFAQSQYSYGRLESHLRQGTRLPSPGGLDEQGRLTDDPATIMRTQRMLPIGYWKGSGLSIVLDLAAALLSRGKSTVRISQNSFETDVSQVFLALRPPGSTPETTAWREQLIREVLDDLHATTPAEPGERLYAPGERVAAARRDAEANGIEVDASVWQSIVALGGGRR